MITSKPNSGCIETKTKVITPYLSQGGGTITPDELSGAAIKKLSFDNIVKWMVYFNAKGKTKPGLINAFQMTIFGDKSCNVIVVISSHFVKS